VTKIGTVLVVSGTYVQGMYVSGVRVRVRCTVSNNIRPAAKIVPGKIINITGRGTTKRKTKKEQRAPVKKKGREYDESDRYTQYVVSKSKESVSAKREGI
jgi:hypothetical protein